MHFPGVWRHLLAFCVRRVLPVLCAGLVLAGCGGDRKDRDGKVHLVLSVPADQCTRLMYRKMVGRFMEKHPHIEVQILEIPKDYYTKVLIMIAGRNAPDVMWMGQSFGELAARGVFMDLSERIKQEVDLDEYLPQALSWYNIGGKQYGVPFGVDMNFVAYNKKLFDEAGVPYPTDDWTFDEFLDRAKRLTVDADSDGRPEQYGFKGGLERAAFGAHMITDDGQRPLCNSPEMIRALQVGMDLAEKWKVSPLPEDENAQGLDYYGYFKVGRTAMMTMYTWHLPFAATKCRDMDWDIVNMPTVKQRGHWASSQATLIYSGTKHPEEAWLLCKEFHSDEAQRTMAQRGLPPNLRVAQEYMADFEAAKLIMAELQAAERRVAELQAIDPEAIECKAAEGRLAELQAAEEEVAQFRGQPPNWAALYKARDSLYPTPRIANLSEIKALYGSAAGGIATHQVTPAEAMANAERSINLFLKRKRRRKR